MQQRLPSQLDPPICFAHRGARAHLQENTMAAFQLALKLGATGLESDVWLTADRIAVLDHDGVVKSGLRRRPISAVRRAELPGHIPTLSELLATCGTDFELSLDLKDPASARQVLDTVTEHDAAMLDRLWLCDTDVERLVDLRGASRGVRLLHSTRLDRIKDGLERHAHRLATANIDGINLNRRDWSGGLVALFHRFERVAFGWDMQLEHELRDGFRMGLDAVYSDHVDVMIDARRAELGAV